MRVGLVLGAGGVVGASWLIGSLDALSEETGWNPSEAEYIVGTSAGSAIGALTAAGQSPRQMASVLSGERALKLVTTPQAGDTVERLAGTEYRLSGLPMIGPGSWRMAVRTLRHPRRYPPAAVLSGWLPRGFVSTEPISRLVERFVPDAWPQHPNYWAVACDYETGQRIAFGREDAPPALVHDAVAASCSIPGFYRPRRIGERRYIDGGVCSPSNLDLLCDHGLDLVVCLNPMSSRVPATGHDPAARVAAAVRAATGRRLGHEARKLREAGTEVLLLQPTKSDLDVMGINLMARDRSLQVLRRARVTTRDQLREMRASGQTLPGSSRRAGRRRVPGSVTRRAA
jgi:NTE family protein